VERVGVHIRVQAVNGVFLSCPFHRPVNGRQMALPTEQGSAKRVMTVLQEDNQ